LAECGLLDMNDLVARLRLLVGSALLFFACAALLRFIFNGIFIDGIPVPIYWPTFWLLLGLIGLWASIVGFVVALVLVASSVLLGPSGIAWRRASHGPQRE
jgi:hypothetical protein